MLRISPQNLVEPKFIINISTAMVGSVHNQFKKKT